MIDEHIRAAAIALYDRFTHDGMDRRDFIAELTKIAGGAMAANALLLGIAADPAGAAIVPAGDRRLRTGTVRWRTGPGRMMSGYQAAPAKAKPAPATVIVIHENRGLSEHIRDVARRLALAGFTAVAPDFLSPHGGTPADEGKAREMIGALDLAATVRDAVATVHWLHPDRISSLRVSAIGFCWGGGMVNRLAVATPLLRSGISFYGPAPDPAEAPKVQAAMMLHVAGLDGRVNATALPWAAALKRARKRVALHAYPGVNHAFHNDTSAERYNRKAADLAWRRTLAFLR